MVYSNLAITIYPKHFFGITFEITCTIAIRISSILQLLSKRVSLSCEGANEGNRNNKGGDKYLFQQYHNCRWDLKYLKSYLNLAF